MRDKNEPIDGDYPINLEFITLAFNILVHKDKVSTDLIKEVEKNNLIIH